VWALVLAKQQVRFTELLSAHKVVCFYFDIDIKSAKLSALELTLQCGTVNEQIWNLK
jgi:hypothetical protein